MALKKPLILVADDDRAMRLLVRRALEKDGYAVIEAEDGAAALETYEKAEPDIVLMDVLMPGMDGFAVCAALQKLPRNRRVPVLMITGLEDDASVEKAFASGATDYITKPLHWAVLRQRVRRLLLARQTEKNLSARETQLSAVASALGEGLIVLDAEGRLTLINPEAERLLGWSMAELLGRNVHPIIHNRRYEGALLPESDCPVLKTIDDGKTYRSDEEYFTRKDGALFPVSLVSTPLRVNDRIIGAVAAFRDISERKEVEEKLLLAAKVIENTTEGIMITDAKGIIQSVNPAFCRSTGYTESESIGNNPRLLKSGRHDGQFYRKMWCSMQESGQWQGEIWNRRKSGELYAAWLTVSAIKDSHGRTTQYAAVFSDMTEDRRNQERIKHQAYHDALTDLPNRLLFIDRLSQALAQANRNHHMLAVLFLDLDRFKQINDTYGHALGDLLLQGVAGRLRSAVRDSDTVARLGGDEFTILLPQISTVEDAAKVAQKILCSFRHPWTFEGIPPFCTTTSIGIAVYPSDGEEAETLMHNADAAMYRAKEQGRNHYQLYTPELNAWAFERLAMETRLRRALENREFLLYYQPKVEAATRKRCALEALIRWQHPDLGLVSPMEFLRLAEDTGLIVPIGLWSLEEACSRNKAWQDAGLPPVKVAVNLSARQLQHPNLIPTVKRALQASGLSPDWLELEISEENILHFADVAPLVLGKLKALGVALTMDQFGKHNSRITLLQKLPVDTVKIAAPLIVDLAVSHDARASVKAMIALAHSLSLRVAVDGVGTQEQYDYLRAAGCDELQGHYFSEPLGAEEIEKLQGVSFSGNAVDSP
ncbi:EAL domain-containing protein [Heliobacterium gestii]|uniref:Stage 0 sporulation protein A homolog n=1 Tax=Heliomicrobium gestii TaxID=2699 RepID=A0A845LNC6_HELGE|nr:EAL domain-containing protein [Heliomicrobium gestii]MBM7868083.1 diguanylate cyclase (GGDEF)-like protein/PAS domain S-box-containing protein [Heliomicrobium gestii]MZP44386.1 EAL domain-containing protein [Heliomicrobium gestii]